MLLAMLLTLLVSTDMTGIISAMLGLSLCVQYDE